MRIKITLIVFFISTFSFIGCMKNDVSPGIEAIRTAYAELLKAKAAAEITISNAAATYSNAQAAYELARAELVLAQANAEIIRANAESALQLALANQQDALAEAIRAQLLNDIALAEYQIEALRAELLHQMAIWEIELQRLELALQIQLDEYEKALVDAENILAEEYFTNYKNALLGMRLVQERIFDKQMLILELEIDIINGTTIVYDGLIADLDLANTILELLKAEYDDALAILGNVDAIKEKIVALEAQSASLENQIATLVAEKAELGLDCTAEEEALAAAILAVNEAITTGELSVEDATLVLEETNLALETAAADFPGPEFWLEAIAAVELAETNLADAINDTVVPYEAWKAADDFIKSGTEDIDGDITDAVDAIADAELAIADLVADTLSKHNALAVADTAVVHKQNEIDAVDVEIADLDDAIAAKQTEIDDLDAEDPRPATYDDDRAALIAEKEGLEAQRTLKVAEKGTLTGELGDLEDTADAALTLYNAAMAAYDSTLPGLEDDIADLEAVIEGLDADKVTRLEQIADAEKRLPDLWSDLQYAKSYLRIAQEELEAALAAKEELRPAYEQYMDEFFGAYLADLETAVADAEAALATAVADAEAAIEEAVAVKEAAMLALEECMAPCVEMQDQIDEAQAQFDLVDDLLGFYGDVDAINDDYLAQFEAAIEDMETFIDDLKADIKTAEEAIMYGEVDIEKFEQDIVFLNTLLETYQAEVAYWKALLDEAIASDS